MLHGWVYDIETGSIEALDGMTRRFVSLAQQLHVAYSACNRFQQISAPLDEATNAAEWWWLELQIELQNSTRINGNAALVAFCHFLRSSRPTWPVLPLLGILVRKPPSLLSVRRLTNLYFASGR
jgi:hypothetical protein